MSGEEAKSLEERLGKLIDRKLAEAMVQPRAVKIEEAARLLSCSARHIARKAKRGKIRFVFPLGLKRVPMSEIVRLTSLSEDVDSVPAPTSPRSQDARLEAEEIRRRAKRKR